MRAFESQKMDANATWSNTPQRSDSSDIITRRLPHRVRLITLRAENTCIKFARWARSSAFQLERRLTSPLLLLLFLLRYVAHGSLSQREFVFFVTSVIFSRSKYFVVTLRLYLNRLRQSRFYKFSLRLQGRDTKILKSSIFGLECY